ncbi:protein At-4/1-like isoform X3 [Zingiber officinale]|uniref:protein At-4/1-like isoform X3 n=1 Tax=Zingiber officinale TaxID=94328 RepID=UPI001C4C6217|nr:protein At-4/1-like isoform X3 [Zingiber officinale]
MEGMENCEELETLVRDFDRIYQGYNDALLEIQSLKMSCNCEVMKREALEATCNDFKAGRMTYHAKCQRLTEEIREANIKLLSLGAEHEKMIDMVKQECNQKIHDLEKQVSCSLDKQASDQVLINQFQRELVTHETHIDILTGNLEMVTSDLQSKYDAEILELKSQLLAEQNVKNDLQVKLQNTENELQIMKQKQEKQQRDSISLHHVETLKQKIMRLRKENESLKRQVAALNDHHI